MRLLTIIFLLMGLIPLQAQQLPTGLLVSNTGVNRWENILKGKFVLERIPTFSEERLKSPAGIFIYSFIGTPPRFSDKDIEGLKRFVADGGIAVFEGYSHVAFRSSEKNVFDLSEGESLLGANRYAYGKFTATQTEICKNIFGNESEINNPFTKELPNGLSGIVTAVPLYASDSKKTCQLTVNRYRKGYVVYCNNASEKKQGFDAMLTKLLDILADQEKADTFFPAPQPNNFVRSGAEMRHLAIASGGDLKSAQIIREKLNVILGENPFSPAAEHDGQIVLHIGKTLKALASGVDFSKLSPYGYLIVRKGNDIFLGGNNDMANRYAVNDFLKRFAGYRKFSDHPLYEIQEPLKFIDIPKDFSYFENPSIASYTLAFPAGNHDFGRNCRQTAIATHSMDKLIPPEKYGKSNPEWYGLFKEKRAPFDQKDFVPWQPCLANPELPRLVAEYADDYFKKNPDRIALPLGVNDGGGDCRCDFCQNERKQYGNSYVRFYNDAARVVAEKHPGKMIAFIAYGGASRAPVGIQMEENIIVEVCSMGRAAYQEFAKWHAAGIRHFGLYDYFYSTGSPYVVPQHYPHIFVEHYRKDPQPFPLSTLWIEYYPSSRPFDAARQYVIDELAWDLHANPDALLKDYFTSMYGEGAGPVEKFFNHLEIIYRRTPGDFYPIRHWLNHASQFDVYQPADLVVLDGFLRDANSLVRDRKAAARLAHLDTFYRLIRHFLVLEFSIRDSGKANSDEQMLMAARSGFEAIIQINDFTMSPEEEKAVFIGKATLPGFKKKIIESHRRLENIVDQSFDRLTAKLLKQGMTKESIAKFYQQKAAENPIPGLREALLSQSWQMLTPDSPNIARNSSFEEKSVGDAKKDAEKPSDWGGLSGIPGWYTWNYPSVSTTYRLEDRESHSGKFSGGIGAGGGGCLINTVSLKSNARYKLEFYVKRNTENDGKYGHVALRMQRNGKWLDTGATLEVPYPDGCVGKWERCTVTFSAPEGGAAALLLFTAPQQPEGTSVWIDDISVKMIYNPNEDVKKK